MAEPGLALKLEDLAIEVGHYLGFGRTKESWTGWQPAVPYVPNSPDSQLAWVMASIEAGLRHFYYPPVLEDGGIAHVWSFLTPETTLQIVAAQTEYALPDSFGWLVGHMYYQPADSSPYEVERVGIGNIRAAQQRTNTLTGKPRMVALTPRPADGVVGQRYKASFWPIPDASYTLIFSYGLQPWALTAQNPYPLGGAQHGETILESCLAVAESRFNLEQAVHAGLFKERLAASISVDVRDYQPEGLGKNLDRSRRRSRWPGNSHDWDNDLVTFNGKVPG